MISSKYDMHKRKGTVNIVCNCCHKEKTIEFPSAPIVAEAIKQEQAEGWLHHKIEGGRFQEGWLDFCSQKCEDEMIKLYGGIKTNVYEIRNNRLELIKTTKREHLCATVENIDTSRKRALMERE